MRIQNKAEIAIMSLEGSRSATTFELPDGRSERLHFRQVSPTQFAVRPPTVDADGTTHIDLEIMEVELEAVSQELWPGQTIRVLGGFRASGKTLRAAVHIPAGKELADGVPAESWLYWQVETPSGMLHNEQPIHMTGEVTQLPPYGSTFRSADRIPLVDSEGVQRLVIYNCDQAN